MSYLFSINLFKESTFVSLILFNRYLFSYLFMLFFPLFRIYQTLNFLTTCMLSLFILSFFPISFQAINFPLSIILVISMTLFCYFHYCAVLSIFKFLLYFLSKSMFLKVLLYFNFHRRNGFQLCFCHNCIVVKECGLYDNNP